MRIGNKEFDTKNNTYIMGILNVTPDSFSDGGKWREKDAWLKHAQEMISHGAAIIDVGGESTRPGHHQISDQEEIDRVVPVVETLSKSFDVPISVDTYKSSVAKEALKAGAKLINDIWGFMYDDQMALVCRKYDAACCLMHNRREPVYNDLINDIINDLKLSLAKAKAAGIKDDRICLDPGIGFGKSLTMNLEVLKKLDRFNCLGYPMLLGASRKSVIGLTLDLPVDKREEGTIVTTVMAVQAGYGFVRVHDAEKNMRAIKMTRSILNI